MSDRMKAMLMEALQNASEESNRGEHTLTEDQQATRLKDIVARLDEGYEFERGDLLRHKYPSMCVYKTGKLIGVFMGYLDEPVDYSTRPHDGTEMGAAKVYDCRVGFIMQDHFVVYLMNSDEYEPYEEG